MLVLFLLLFCFLFLGLVIVGCFDDIKIIIIDNFVNFDV